jgi:transposase-like protein
MKKRRKFSAEFKAKVAFDAMPGDLTLLELASKYNVHANMIPTWKKHAHQGVVDSGRRDNKTAGGTVSEVCGTSSCLVTMIREFRL